MPALLSGFHLAVSLLPLLRDFCSVSTCLIFCLPIPKSAWCFRWLLPPSGYISNARDCKSVDDLNLMRRNIGQTIPAAGMIDDIISWIMLFVVAGLASGESVTIGTFCKSWAVLLLL